MPRISIVIPTKNEEKMLPRLLETIAAQTHQDKEIIVADFPSTDQTQAIARSHGALVVQGGLVGRARNSGAARAEGEFIAFFDADVQLPSNKFLEDCIAEMDRKKLDVATCKVKPLSRKPIDRALHEVYNAFAVATEKIRPHAPGFCILVRNAVHKKIGGFDEGVVFAEDHEYVQRAQKQGHKFGLLRSHPIAASVRRLEKDGRLAIAFKYIFSELHMMTKGPIKTELFEYTMGGDEKKKDT